MSEPNELKIPPDRFENFLKNSSSVSGVVYEANKKQFEKAVGEKKIKPMPLLSSRISINNETISETYTFRWKWIGQK